LAKKSSYCTVATRLYSDDVRVPPDASAGGWGITSPNHEQSESEKERENDGVPAAVTVSVVVSLLVLDRREAVREGERLREAVSLMFSLSVPIDEGVAPSVGVPSVGEGDRGVREVEAVTVTEAEAVRAEVALLAVTGEECVGVPEAAGMLVLGDTPRDIVSVRVGVALCDDEPSVEADVVWLLVIVRVMVRLGVGVFVTHTAEAAWLVVCFGQARHIGLPGWGA
jgi:hypothetical protein